MTAAVMEYSTGQLRLSRPGARGNNLRAWDAADELLLAAAMERLEAGARVLIIDDQFGALTLGLSAFSPETLSDSALLAKALDDNLKLNPGIPVPPIPASWLAPPQGRFDLVVMRIPRQADYLAWLLRWCNGILAAHGCLLAGGMIKHLPDKSVDVFAENLLTEAVLPARKKARVVVCRPGSASLKGWSGCWKGYRTGAMPAQVEALPAVFSRDKLDIGTAELLPLVAPAAGRLPAGARVLDLACGNGVLGMSALASRDDIAVDFADVSSQAVASVRHNLESSGYLSRGTVHHCDAADLCQGPYNLILLNPPFHEAGAVGDHIARRLFRGAARHLADDGRLLMVGNRHLGYHVTLRRYFRLVKQLSSSARFVVFEAQAGNRQVMR